MSYLNDTPNEKEVFHTCNMLHPVGLGSSTIHNGPAGSELVNDSQLCNQNNYFLRIHGLQNQHMKSQNSKIQIKHKQKYYLFQRVIK